MVFLIPSHPLTNFELEIYYQKEPRFNGVFSRNSLPKKIKDGVYIINLDEHANVCTHFDSFDVEYILEEIKDFIGNKNIKNNIF